MKIKKKKNEEKIEETQTNEGLFSKKNLIIIGGAVAVFIVIFIIISLFRGGKKKNEQVAQPGGVQQVTINDVKLDKHQDFLSELESDKDLMIETLNNKFKTLEVAYSLDDSAKQEFASQEAQLSAKHATILKGILEDVVNIQDSDSDKAVEIIRQRIARNFDDELSKATYQLVEGASPSKALDNKSVALVGSPIISRVYGSENFQSCEIVVALVAGKDDTKNTAFYQVFWNKEKIVSIKFLGLVEGFDYEQ